MNLIFFSIKYTCDVKGDERAGLDPELDRGLEPVSPTVHANPAPSLYHHRWRRRR